jgi:hypothetical protein
VMLLGERLEDRRGQEDIPEGPVRDQEKLRLHHGDQFLPDRPWIDGEP